MKNILVVDDEFGVAEVLEAILQDEGYRVATAINGRQGLQRVAESRPDLILLDFMMPILNGAGMLRALQADPALASIPVIMMSSLAESTVAEECRGYTTFLRKPFSATTVIATVALVLA